MLTVSEVLGIEEKGPVCVPGEASLYSLCKQGFIQSNPVPSAF